MDLEPPALPGDPWGFARCGFRRFLAFPPAGRIAVHAVATNNVLSLFGSRIEARALAQIVNLDTADRQQPIARCL